MGGGPAEGGGKGAVAPSPNLPPRIRGLGEIGLCRTPLRRRSVAASSAAACMVSAFSSGVGDSRRRTRSRTGVRGFRIPQAIHLATHFSRSREGTSRLTHASRLAQIDQFPLKYTLSLNLGVQNQRIDLNEPLACQPRAIAYVCPGFLI